LAAKTYQLLKGGLWGIRSEVGSWVVPRSLYGHLTMGAADDFVSNVLKKNFFYNEDSEKCGGLRKK